jgi:cation diffusion facilitator family transporter
MLFGGRIAASSYRMALMMEPVQHPEDAQGAATADAYRQASVGAWVGIVGNILLGGAKLAGGILGSSTALVADAGHSLSDSLSSIVVLWGLIKARKPADEKHPYGHGKAEFMAARMVAIMLILVAVVLGYDSVDRLLHPPENPMPRPFTLWFVAASILIKEAMFQYKIRLGKRLKSESLMADAWHHRSDALSSVCALFGISAAIILGPKFWVLDPVAALFIVAIILAIGIRAFRRTGSILLDEVADEQTVGAIRSAAMAIEGVRDIEKILTRRSGIETHADLHVEVDPEMSVRRGHGIASCVTEAIRRDVPSVTHVTVHIEPYYPDDH